MNLYGRFSLAVELVSAFSETGIYVRYRNRRLSQLLKQFTQLSLSIIAAALPAQEPVHLLAQEPAQLQAREPV